MLRINPDFLISREVEFEICLRGEEPASSAEEKRKQLRGLLRSGKALVSEGEIKLEPGTDLEWCRERAGELLASVGDLGESPDLKCRTAFRLRLGLEHMERRLAFWSQIPDADNKWAFRPLLTQVREGLLKLSPKETDGTSDEGTLDNQGSELQTSTTEAPPNLVAPSVVPAHRDDSLTGQNAIAVATPMTMSQGSVSYNRLPNPLGTILQQLPTTDGVEVNELLQFLGVLLRVRDFPGMTEADTLQVAYPYCRSPLTELLIQCMGSGATFDEFHRTALETFIPGRMKERLCQERLYRLQNPGETLASFVSNIKWVAKVLRVGLLESEIVSTILEGITPEERSRLVFSSRPSTFADLDKLSVTSRMVAYTDGLRQGQPTRRVEQVMTIREVPAEPTGGPSREFVCWGCGQKGHTRRFCRQKGRPPPQAGNAMPVMRPEDPVERPKNLHVGGESSA